MFKTLYKSTHRRALTVFAALLLATTTAAAAAVNMLARQPAQCEPAPATLGRFTVTPERASFVAVNDETPSLGRFVVTPSATTFIATRESETAANL